jgi:hypothetical protein
MSSSGGRKGRKKSAPKKSATAKKQAGKKPAKKTLPAAKRASSNKRASAKKKPNTKKAASKKSAAAPPAPKQSAAKKKSPSQKTAMAKTAPAKGVPKKKAPAKAKLTKKKISPEEQRAEMLAFIARLNAIADAPENQNCVWLVELVIPPGTFMARRVEEPVDRAELEKEVAASTQVLRHGGDRNRHRFLITYTGTGGVARQWAKAMTEEIPSPTVPMSNWDLFTIDAVLHAQFLGDEEY